MQRRIYSSAALVTVFSTVLLSSTPVQTKGAIASHPYRLEQQDSLPPTLESLESIESTVSTPSIQLASRLRRYSLRFNSRSSPYRRGGFSRGESCPEGQEITGITPFVNTDGEPIEETAPTYLTASHHPTFFFHVPQLPATNGLLTVQSQSNDVSPAEEYYYRTEFQLSGDAGIVGVRMPEDAPPLQEGVDYVWRVSVACKPGDIEDSLTTHGGVLNFVSLSSDSTPLDLEAYLQAEIWQESLTILAEERYAASSSTSTLDADLESDWEVLLNTAGLVHFADEPIVQIINADD
ncbi:MAG: DUF928 domain-containing protein [Leptolyngbyaceae bacterium]|nr:DUF928 domain-containing protein [Leptolyngbyaceae bacterium]